MRKVLIVGAGNSGSILIRDISSSQSGDIKVMGLLDDDSRLHNRLISDVRVLGSIDSLSVHVKDFEVDEVFLAIPSASSGERRRILDICSKVGVKARVIPQLAMGNQPGYGDLRRVEIEDLLGRDSVRIDTEGIRKTLAGKVVAVTGAAGSIGAELCRQIAMMRPAKILLIEIDESRLYEIFLELRELGTTELVMHVCDIRDDRKLSDVFRSEKPEVVLHAAAYKHVPLMELAPDEAIKTNVGGTRNVLAACEATGVENFVLISTDKAVSPTTVMGLTKAIAERLMIDACRRGMKASAVRFGNVLGSRGSVVPLFEEQLRRGRPLRVTHPDVTRYFMTIPEAARLVLQAQALSEGGEIFVLEMGEPVKIVDLAQKMITLSGADSSIEFSGLRPAEKLHEVLVAAEEELLETGAEKIDHVSSLPIPPTGLEGIVNTLGMFARLDDRDGMKVVIGALMPDFVGYGENLMVENEVAATGLAEGLDSEMETLF